MLNYLRSKKLFYNLSLVFKILMTIVWYDRHFNNLNTKLKTLLIKLSQTIKHIRLVIQLENEIETIECQQIINKIIIDRLLENKNENITILIQNIGKELNINKSHLIINDLHRIGFNHNKMRLRKFFNFSNYQDKVNQFKSWQIVRNLHSKCIGIILDVHI